MMTKRNKEIIEKLSDQKWRIENLYYIKDQNGNKVLFKPNWAQKELLNNLHHKNVILKARQLGITTFFSILFLDICFWNNNLNAAIIADKRENSEEIFKDKVKYALDNMPEWAQQFNSGSRDNVRELRFDSKSVFRVGTSMRSSSIQYLHVSEFGKICKKSPSHANEIITGSLNAVSKDGFITIESTAEGSSGHFFNICKDAEVLQKTKKQLTNMDFKFFFFPWHRHPEYVLDDYVMISSDMIEYFQDLEEKKGISLTTPQKNWYVKKFQTQQELMKQEFPSTPDEAFESTTEGYFYAKHINLIKENNQIRRVPHTPNKPVYAAWDLGRFDFTAIWFFQMIDGMVHFIDYYEDNGELADFYGKKLQNMPYVYGTLYLPHDGNTKHQNAPYTWKETLTNLGFNVSIGKRTGHTSRVYAVRSVLHKCVFDEEKCALGLQRLISYKRKWNENLGRYTDEEVSDESCHGADALGQAAEEIINGIDISGEMNQEKATELWNKYGAPY